jgi:lipoprotein Spr
MTVTGRIPEAIYPKLNPSECNSLKLKYSAIIKVLPEAIRNLQLYEFIDDWYGVRYRYGGNSKAGIDCSAFVQRVYEEVFGMGLLRTAFTQAGMTRLLWNREFCKEGDLVFFHTKGRQISHVGIYLANNFFVHASTSQGIMISSLDDDYWQKRFSCAGRLL